MFSLFDQESLQEILDILTHFETNTGLKLNYDKSTVYRLGSLRNSDAIYYTTKQLIWTNDSINVLGIEIDHNPVNMLKHNYDTIIDKVTLIFQSWHNRELSLLGKTMLINALVVWIQNERTNIYA